MPDTALPPSPDVRATWVLALSLDLLVVEDSPEDAEGSSLGSRAALVEEVSVELRLDRDGICSCRACVPSISLAATPADCSCLQLPFNVGWQDLKDLFRAAGSIIRADTKTNPDGTPSGTGTVVYETAQDAQNAIGPSSRLTFSTSISLVSAAMYNGFEFQGNILEVREDRSGPPGGGGGRGGFGGGFGRGGFQGGFPARGGFGGGFGGHQQFAPDPYAIPGAEFGGGFQGGFTGGRGGFGNQFAPRGFNASYAGSVPGVVVPPSTQIFVKNVRPSPFLALSRIADGLCAAAMVDE